MKTIKFHSFLKPEKNPLKVSAKTTPNSATMAGTRKKNLGQKYL
jgi:hypothetical protein